MSFAGVVPRSPEIAGKVENRRVPASMWKTRELGTDCQYLRVDAAVQLVAELRFQLGAEFRRPVGGDELVLGAPAIPGGTSVEWPASALVRPLGCFSAPTMLLVIAASRSRARRRRRLQWSPLRSHRPNPPRCIR